MITDEAHWLVHGQPLCAARRRGAQDRPQLRGAAQHLNLGRRAQVHEGASLITLSHTHLPSRTHSHMHMLMHTYTHTHARTHTHTLTHTQLPPPTHTHAHTSSHPSTHVTHLLMSRAVGSVNKGLLQPPRSREVHGRHAPATSGCIPTVRPHRQSGTRERERERPHRRAYSIA